MNIHLIRQIDHWRAAAQRLSQLNNVASPTAWAGLESYTGLALRQRLDASLRTLVGAADRLMDRAREGRGNPTELQRELQALRQDYLRTEVTLDYFGDAINTRIDGSLGHHMAALDEIAASAMRRAVVPLGYQAPPVLTYIDKGLGASILKAGLRLWDRRGVNPVAVIKVVRHNIYRPTALIHEAGHQIAYILNWNRELADALRQGLAEFGPRTASFWAGWSAEIAADAFAFIFTGYAAVATLQDVLAGGPGLVFHFNPGAPHPIPYLRTLLGVAMCRRAFGSGPWDEMADDWKSTYPLSGAPKEIQAWLRESDPVLEKAAEIILDQPMQAFGGRSLQAHIPPEPLRPSKLLAWGAPLGPPAAWTPEDLRRDTLRLLALSVYKQVTESYQNDFFRREMDGWFGRLGANRLHYSTSLT